ncbi:unnamed protein product [Rhizophagus irregularis]|uniref:Myb-like domain-containing protein n=1 Tax=Rhizophagus irregularis TaxID=588596 RepID=A0A2N1MVB0_9GLOM|nr:hypothetical protein RhiirC2_808686 [Rhizophagus irregularis]CAB4383713.1 unnamed protein product [Rhizophagus irregularis]CAB5353337.1 unnamed protein product [Rhizophagus irregularis]
MGKAKKTKGHSFSSHYDKIILENIKKLGNHKDRYLMISKLPGLYLKFTSKQIRQRYTNILDPALCHDPLGDDERMYIIQEIRLNPNNVSWKKLTLKMNGQFSKLRSENKIKNFWTSTKKSLLSRRDIHPEASPLDILVEEALRYDFSKTD